MRNEKESLNGMASIFPEISLLTLGGKYDGNKVVDGWTTECLLLLDHETW